MGKKRLEIHPGEVYGRLTVIEEVEIPQSNGKTRRGAKCKCSCGNPKDVIVRLDGLIKGDYKSCGCYHKEILMTSGKKNKKYNTYNLSGEYGVGYTLNGQEFIFDLEDYESIKEYCWCVSNDGYIVSQKEGSNSIRLHRLLMKANKGEVIDHINRNKLDNRKENLRRCTPKENSRNISIQKNNKSGITGVNFDKRLNKWVARIKVNYKGIHLGVFDTKEEAAKARYDAELLYFGIFSPNYEKLTQQQSQNESSKPSEQQNT